MKLFEILRLRHFLDDFDLGLVNLDPFIADNKAQEFPKSDSKRTLEWVHLQLKFPQTFEDTTKIWNMVAFLFRFDYQVIDVTLNCLVEHIIKNILHCPLICCPRIL